MMSVDEQVQKVLERYAAFGAPPLVTLAPQQARQRPTIRDAVQALREERGETVTPEAVGEARDEVMQGPESDIRLRIYRPAEDGPLPLLVYFHGGGWVLGDLDSCDATCRALTNQARCLVVSVNYRLAPEHPFPAAVQDAYTAWQWVIAQAARLGGDATRAAVGGDDAGGNLAAVVAQMARDSQGHLPLYQALAYPLLDYNFSTVSYERNAYVRPLTRNEMRWFWSQYLPNPMAGDNVYASPLRANDQRDLPPGVILTAEFDTVRDEGEAYGRLLEEAGVPMVLHRRLGMVHNFLDMAPVVKEAREGLLEMARWLRQAFYPMAATVGAEEQTPAGAQMAGAGQASAEDELVRGASLQEDAARGVGTSAKSAAQEGTSDAERAEAPHAPLETGLLVRVGMPVVAADGQVMGKVKAVGTSNFVVDRRFHRDITVPFEAIYEARDRVILSISAQEVTRLDWLLPNG